MSGAAASPRPATLCPARADRRSLDISHEGAGQPQAARPSRAAVRKKYATLRGKHRSGCVRGTAGWLRRANPVSWPLPRSPAKWSVSSGPSPASSSQWSQTRAHSERATRRGADNGRQALWICRCAGTTLTHRPQLHRANNVTFNSIEEKRKNQCRQPSRSKPPEPSRSKPHQTIQSCALPETRPRWGTLLTCYEPVRRPTLVTRVRQPRDESTVMR
jgi:hypothetical protein